MKTALRLTVAAFALAAFNLTAATLYVSLDSANPTPPYATWATAATNIQDAVDAAKAGDTVVVTNGVYAVGSRDVGIGPSRVTVTNSIRLESVNGPLVTVVQGEHQDENGGEGARCVCLATDAVLSGFTLTNGIAPGGGGVWCSSTDAIVTNCVIANNGASMGGGVCRGTLYRCTLTGNGGKGVGGAWNSTLHDCTLTGNSGITSGGASGCTLHNCTLTGNSPGSGGGFYNCIVTENEGGISGTAYNCIVTGNSGGSDGTFYNCTVIDNEGGISGTAFNSIIYYNAGGNYVEGTTLNFSCTTPLPTNGIGNIAGPPLFMDLAAGDFRLREDSPCIDAGTNLLGMTWTYGTATWDPDTGEEIMAVGHISDPTDLLGNTRFIDGNGDGKVAWDIGAYEFNSFKPPRFAVQPQLTADGWKLNITGAADRWARLERSANLKDWEQVWSGFMGAEGVQQVSDGDTGQGLMFYRVVVP